MWSFTDVMRVSSRFIMALWELVPPQMLPTFLSHSRIFQVLSGMQLAALLSRLKPAERPAPLDKVTEDLWEQVQQIIQDHCGEHSVAIWEMLEAGRLERAFYQGLVDKLLADSARQKSDQIQKALVQPDDGSKSPEIPVDPSAN